MASAAILGGGRASRFHGRDKGALVIGGQTFLDRQLEALSQVTDDIMLVGHTPSGPALSGLDLGLRLVDDRVPFSGPLGGLDAALAAARDEVVLIVACDMPFVTAAFLSYLVTQAGEADRADAVVPKTERGYHPLCAAYIRQCHPRVVRRLAQRRLAMLGLLDDLQVRSVELKDLRQFGDSERLLANVNTPDELRGLEARLGHER